MYSSHAVTLLPLPSLVAWLTVMPDSYLGNKKKHFSP